MVTELTIRDFRNIAALDVALPPTGVVIIGPNGQGKTNLLEALYYLVLFRSLRGAKDRQLVRFGSPAFFVAGRGGSRVTAGYEIAGRRKKVTVDGVAVEKLAAAVGEIVAVPFSPADRRIVTEGPAMRRRYLDVLLSLGHRGYLTALTEMRLALRQRNAALRRGDAAAARAFDPPFLAAAERVATFRTRWVEERAGRFAELCGLLGEERHPAMVYRARSWTPGDIETLRRAVAASIDRDVRRGMTTVGPHRDDVELRLGDRELRTFGSAGQQRTAAIALRLVEAETLADATGRTPVALYDDVFVELDDTRQARLLELIQTTLPGQVIVTAPRDSEVPPALFERPRWTMREGRLATA